MELFCEKYKEKLDSEDVRCQHPEDYCQHRKSCLIHFMEQESRREIERDGNGEKEMANLNFQKGDGLLPAIVQDYKTNEVLMLAYINEQSWEKTLSTGKAHYWSRSRNTLWLKGESSNHIQLVKEILVDCDEDTVVFRVEQLGGAACHKGYKSCFYRRVEKDDLIIKDEPVFDPQEVYKK
jgi:phosphoribosyl-AMP cyclohydrolase